MAQYLTMEEKRKQPSWVAYFVDPQGMPRAFGQASTEVDATAIAQLELIAYRDKKNALGDPLGTAEYHLTVKRVA